MPEWFQAAMVVCSTADGERLPAGRGARQADSWRAGAGERQIEVQDQLKPIDFGPVGQRALVEVVREQELDRSEAGCGCSVVEEQAGLDATIQDSLYEHEARFMAGTVAG